MNRPLTMTGEERQFTVERLESSRDKFLATIDGISPAQAAFQPDPERWSILQCAEHIAISDEGLLNLIRAALAKPAEPELMEQVQANDYRYQRETRQHKPGVNKAPKSLSPHARFATLAEASTEFLRQREGIIVYARATQDALRGHMSPHPVFGPMDAYQWLVACAIHVESHTLQIQELKDHPDYPT
jgi:DinB superfamily